MTINKWCDKAVDAHRQLDEWTAIRNDAIRQAVQAGGSFREVSRAVGLSHTAVRFIVNGRPARNGK